MPGECVAHLVRSFAILVAAKWQLRPVWLLWAAWHLWPLWALCPDVVFIMKVPRLAINKHDK